MGTSRKILFYSRSPMNTVMLRPLVRRLSRDPRLRLYFSGKPSNPDEPLADVYRPLWDDAAGSSPAAGAISSPAGPNSQSARPGVPPVRPSPVRRPAVRLPVGRLPVGRLLARWRLLYRTFDLFICPDIVMYAWRARHRVQIFHGVSFKGKVYTEKIRRFNHVFLVGEYMRRRFEEKGILAPGDSCGHRIGMPKTDPLVDGSLDRAALLESHGFDPARPTVLYAPTWRKESSLNVEGEAVIDALDRMGLNVLVKIHDHSRDPRTNRLDWGAWLDAREGGNVRRVRDPDIIPSLHAADVLVSDASSVTNEFTLLDRPILFMDVPKLLEVYRDTSDLETWGRRIGEVVRGAAALPSAVEHALSNPGALSDIRRAAATDIFYNPGHAAQAAVAAIYHILELSAE